MACNLGTVERTIRVTLGLALIGIAYVGSIPHVAALMLYVAGAILLVTATVGFCPAWKLLGLNTCRPMARKPSA